ncbi:MAG: cupin domain-containing protein [Chloroflexi bacterium]|nr:cupin domain-containing protein [Chloroflexota bacterium]
MHRLAAVAGGTVGSRNLWVGLVTMAPGARSGAHHHGDCESVIYITRGRARFRFGERLEQTVEAGPGDFIYVPPRAVHQEKNASDSEGIEMIVCRDSQENVVVNVDLPESSPQER